MDKINLFIVADNPLVVYGLKHYLEQKFGSTFCIQNFCDTRKMLRCLNASTGVVVADFILDGRNGTDVLRSIRTISPDTEIIMHSSSEDVADRLEKFLSRRTSFYNIERSVPQYLYN